MNRIAIIGNYVPRQCGIATFTTDLCESIASQFPQVTSFAIPVNDRPQGYAYPPRVRFELAEDDVTSYHQAADFLNINKVDVVCLQHEFGIFGGAEGSHILGLLDELRMPLVTTLHTVPHQPNAVQRKVLEAIAERSDRLVVMTQKGRRFLEDIYRIAEEKIVVIPHGIPDVPFTDPNYYKDHFGVEGRFVLLTFGLLSRNKGIEYVVRALPRIVRHVPKAVYVVVGATHPNVLRAEGESYRLSIQRLARKLGVEKHIVFHNRFVSLEELVEFIGAADVYITPYLNRDQIVSGTLAYALGMGKAVVSTPYWHAEELLADGAGLLVPFRDAEHLADAVIRLAENEAERHAMRKQGYKRGRKMIWPEVAKRYMETFETAIREHLARPRIRFRFKTLGEKKLELPAIKLDYLAALTDSAGVLQHAVGTVPNLREGYCTDDNARALVLTVLLDQLGKEQQATVRGLARRYLGLLWYAFNDECGRFRNFMGCDRSWKESVGSPDSHGRCLWALATVLGRSDDEGLRIAAGRLFEQALPAVHSFPDLRPAAYCLIGLREYLKRYEGDRTVQQSRTLLAERLLSAYRNTAASDWPWFEPKVTYANARLPHALLLAGSDMGRHDMVDAALESLDWLVRIQTASDGHFRPIGNNGFYFRGQSPARFDQQPIEAAAMVSACLAAHRATREERWLHEARRAFEWFLGRNDVGASLYDPVTGGCYDGLTPQGVNRNQGAESTICFLMALGELHLQLHRHPVSESPDGEPVSASSSCGPHYLTESRKRETAPR